MEAFLALSFVKPILMFKSFCLRDWLDLSLFAKELSNSTLLYSGFFRRLFSSLYLRRFYCEFIYTKLAIGELMPMSGSSSLIRTALPLALSMPNG
jgi:hypothetical protein